MVNKRCIISFIDNKNYLLLEMYYLFESFIESKLYENSDLILCGPKEIKNLVPEHPCVFYLENKSISENCNDNEYKAFKDYHFINSISCIILNKEWLLNKNYEYMLKTDSDVFLTPNFKDFFPDITKIYTGKGGYSHNDSKDKLKNIAKRENLRYQNVTDIGATWYGSCKLLIDIAELTLKLTKIILEKDFATNEGVWPGFFKGVSSMYGSELAINDLVDKDKIIITQKFDGHSDSTESWKDNDVYHIHCWHTDKMFSKFQNRNMKYIDYDKDKLDYNKTNEYCLLLTLKHKDKLLSLMKPNSIIENFYYNKIQTTCEPTIYRYRYKPKYEKEKINILDWCVFLFIIFLMCGIIILIFSL